MWEGRGASLLLVVLVISLQEKVCEDLYEELDRMIPVLQYLLAPQLSRKTKDGMSALRQGVAAIPTPQQKKDPETLDAKAKMLVEWFAMPKSKIRMLLHWQAGS